MIFPSPNKKLLGQSDIDLIIAYQSTASELYYNELISRYGALIYGVARKHGNSKDAEDIVMIVFNKLYTNLPTLDVKNFRNWIYTITRNQAVDFFRKNKKEAETKFILQKNKSSFMEYEEWNRLLYKTPNSISEDILHNSLQQLKSEQKICIEAFYLKEKSYKEIVDETGFTYNKVKSCIQNGKANLQKLLSRKIMVKE